MRRELLIGAALLITLTCSAHAQSLLYKLCGDDSGDGFGSAVSGAGDVNRDGYPDLVVGAPDRGPNPYPGAAFVYSGRDGTLLYLFEGRPGSYDGLGTSVGAAGDVNGDGWADIIVGAADYYVTGAGNVGRAVVYSGRDGSELLSMVGTHHQDGCGWAVSGIGDLTGDGHDDVIVGAPWTDDHGIDSGSAFVLSGTDGSVLFTVRGNSAGEMCGMSVYGAGDVNGDGRPDFIVGMPGGDRAVVYSGGDESVLFEFHGDRPGEFGWSVSGAGDINADDFADVIVGAPGASMARVYSGRDGTVLHSIYGPGGGSWGYSVSGIGRIDGDAFDDFALGNSVGPYVYVFSGRTGNLIYAVDGERSVSGAGDIDQDGFGDFIFGGTGCSPSGAAYVYSGVVHAAWSNYGAGWPGSNGIPSLTPNADPKLCTEIVLSVGNSRGSATPAIMLVGPSETEVPTIYGGELLVLFSVVFPLSLPSPGAALPVTLPCDSALVGASGYLQVLEVDPGASKGVSFTAGLKLLLGR